MLRGRGSRDAVVSFALMWVVLRVLGVARLISWADFVGVFGTVSAVTRARLSAWEVVVVVET